jgi:hypothetical protein
LSAGRQVLLCLPALLLAGCELQEVELAVPEDAIVAEVILRAGASRQLAWLHRTTAPDTDPTVMDALVQVRAAGGSAVAFAQVADTACIIPRMDAPDPTGTCYASPPGALAIEPGRTYELVIQADRRVLTGTTTVPADFRIIRPSASSCSIAAQTNFDIMWQASDGAWVYAGETALHDIRSALAPYSIPLDRDPLRLFGLALSSADTTIAYPREFGLFDRLDDDLVEALAFLQRGLPAGVNAEVVIAAADRNYVNWERGGNFNPSGQVRVPSIRGDGTGVFGSLVPKAFSVEVDKPGLAGC